MVTISPAIQSDAAAILELQRSAYQSEARLYNDWSLPPLTQMLDSMLQDMATMTVLKAIQDEKLVGSVRGILQDGICNIGRLIVEPSHQRRGIGSALLRAIETNFPTARAFSLFTGGRSEENLRLYRRHDYRETHREQVAPHLIMIFLQKQAAPVIQLSGKC
ncbi:MAG: GNAT family N-acetyltransferase [Desulfobulbus sp.]